MRHKILFMTLILMSLNAIFICCNEDNPGNDNWEEITSTPTPTPTPDFSNGLIAYYPFNGNAEDESGNQNHGIVHGAQLTTNRNGDNEKAYVFDGTNDYIDFGIFYDFDASSTSFSVCYWILSLKGSDNYCMGTDANKGWYTRVDYGESEGKGTLLIKIDDDLSESSGFGSTNIENGQWHFCALTLNHETNEFLGYIDGNLEILLSTGDVGDLRDHFDIGRIKFDSGENYFIGKIDDTRIYNRAIAASEIIDIYNYE